MKKSILFLAALFTAVCLFPSYKSLKQKGKISEEVFHLSVNDFYLTDPISKSSKTMISCSNEFKEKN